MYIPVLRKAVGYSKDILYKRPRYRHLYASHHHDLDA